MSPSPLPFFFNTPATTQIYTLSLHDALPIYDSRLRQRVGDVVRPPLRRADVADVHDVPAVTTHGARRGLGAEEGAAQVQVEMERVLRRGGAEERRPREDGRVVDEDVEAAEASHGVAHARAGLPRVRQIGAERDGARARGLELTHETSGLPRRAVVADRDVQT